MQSTPQKKEAKIERLTKAIKKVTGLITATLALAKAVQKLLFRVALILIICVWIYDIPKADCPYGISESFKKEVKKYIKLIVLEVH
jgi:hypothetical protein